jgi:hypothetical protein
MDLNLHALTRHFVRLLHLGPISPISISVIAYKLKNSTTNRNGHWTDWTRGVHWALRDGRPGRRSGICPSNAPSKQSSTRAARQRADRSLRPGVRTLRCRQGLTMATPLSCVDSSCARRVCIGVADQSKNLWARGLCHESPRSVLADLIRGWVRVTL